MITTQEQLDAAMSEPLKFEDTSALYQRELAQANDFWDHTVDFVIGGGELSREDMDKEKRDSLLTSQAAIARKLPPRR